MGAQVGNGGSGRTRRSLAEINVTPLVDVVFLLLVFFLLTSTYVTQESVELSLPSSDSAAVRDQAPVTVSLDADWALYLDGRAVDASEFEAVLSASLTERDTEAVTLKADRSVQLQSLLRIMDRIRAAGAAELALATDPRTGDE